MPATPDVIDVSSKPGNKWSGNAMMIVILAL